MKTAATQLLRAKVAAGRPAFGLWVTLESASVSEMAVALGLLKRERMTTELLPTSAAPGKASSWLTLPV